MGLNTFGPVRGPWSGVAWWGRTRRSTIPVFVLTDHAHEPIEMAGGTTSYSHGRHLRRPGPPPDYFECAGVVASAAAIHVRLARTPSAAQPPTQQAQGRAIDPAPTA